MKITRMLKTQRFNDTHGNAWELPKWSVDMARHALKSKPYTLSAYGYSKKHADIGRNSVVDHEVATGIMYQLFCVEPGRYSSYSLKHESEAWGRNLGYSTYVSNGALILGAIFIRAHFDDVIEVQPQYRKRGNENSPNATIIVRKKEFKITRGDGEFHNVVDWQPDTSNDTKMRIGQKEEVEDNYIATDEDDDEDDEDDDDENDDDDDDEPAPKRKSPSRFAR